MRIGVIGPVNPDDFADNVISALVTMGHEVYPLGAARPPIEPRRVGGLASIVSDRYREIDAIRQGKLRKKIESLRPPIVISTDRRVHASTIRAVHSYGGKIGLWFPDSTNTMGSHDMFLAGFDRIYLKNPFIARDLSRIQNLPVRHLPEAANRIWHTSTKEYGTSLEVVMAGNIHPTRAILLDHLIADGIPVRIYGKGVMPSWVDLPRVRSVCTEQYLSRQNKADTFRSARAVLNNLHPAESAGMNCRLFEAAAAGAAVVTEVRPGLSDLFSMPDELFCFSTYAELLTTLRNLLDSAEAGRETADAAAARALREHTYEKRLEVIISDLSESGS